MAKIRDTLPSIGPALPQHLVMKAAMQQRGPAFSGRLRGSGGFNSLGVLDGGRSNYFVAGTGFGAALAAGATIKRESGSSSTSGASSPYESPNFLYYYPLA